ncbi:MAG TPA: RNA polymerase sigma-70 factor [Pedobacter sp.]
MSKCQLSDIQLWTAIKTGDEPAFNELFGRYWIRLYKTAFQYLKDKEASEEVVHDVFLNIWNRRKQLDISFFPNFILTAVRYQVYNRMRSARSPLIYESDLVFTTGTDANLGEHKIEEQDLYRNMYEYLEELPKRCREIFCMSRIDQLSNEEIAGRLGISKRTVENQITAALKHLKACYRYIAMITVLSSQLTMMGYLPDPGKDKEPDTRKTERGTGLSFLHQPCV